MPLASAAISALLNFVVLGGLPFLIYFAYQKWRHKRSFKEIAQ
jgi:threonine/homoserine/homoserine lactone efflux protein